MEKTDREITHLAIHKAQIVGQGEPLVLYQIDLRNDIGEWTVLKRFSAFKALEEHVFYLII